ncbi:MAG: TRAM domain-containing protein, partial [Acidobacteria bacterium]|nr:TRAM domain-containing protein [Acidobacteriota bacterium]
MTQTGELLTLAIERPAVGGRMIARHDGAIVLVAGAIPGERVTARVERVQRRTVFARTVEVLEASPDRVAADAGLACGGHVFAHIAAPRQAALKAEMITDAFRRQGRLEIDAVPVSTGPADGYRTRARVHLRRGRWGFFEEGSHALCDISASRQLRAESAAVLDTLCA